MSEKSKDLGRWADPKAWECLDDEQREIIHNWYKWICDEKEKKQKRMERTKVFASYYALTPFIFAYALQRISSLWEFLVNLVSAFVVYSLIFYIFNYAYVKFVSREEDKVSRIIKEIVAVVVSFLLTNLVLHKCGII